MMGGNGVSSSSDNVQSNSNTGFAVDGVGGGLGLKIGGGSRVGFGYNTGSRRGGLQIWL